MQLVFALFYKQPAKIQLYYFRKGCRFSILTRRQYIRNPHRRSAEQIIILPIYSRGKFE